MTSDLNTTFGHRPIYIRGEAATFIPNSSFLIPHSSFLIPNSSFLIPHFFSPLPFPCVSIYTEQSFHTESKGAPPHGLTLNLEP